MTDEPIFPAEFSAATTEYSEFAAHVPAPLMRRSFMLEGKPSTARILICGLGFYRLFVNGREITKGLLAPYISNPDDICYYDLYDVAPMLDGGKNAVCVMLGNGFLNSPGGRVWDFDKAEFRSAPKLAISLVCDGETVISSSRSFVTHPSAILFDDLRSGERYDARLECDGWTEPCYDDSGWAFVIPATEPKGEKRVCTADPIIKSRELLPVAPPLEAGVIEPARVEGGFAPCSVPDDELSPRGLLFDFGENIAGIFRLELDGVTDQKIILQFGEAVTDGNLDLSMMYFLPNGYDHRCVYICRGGHEVYEPSFTYFGYRYCLVCGLTAEQAKTLRLTCVVCHSDIKQTASFSCSDETANALYSACLRSDLANFYYFPTDCPHREKNGWTGDASISAEQIMYNFEAGNSLSVWMDNIRKAQKPSGELPGIIPTGGWGFAWGNGPAWDSVIVNVPAAVYDLTGDLEILRDNADAIWKYLGYLSEKETDEGLYAFGLGDWCPVGGKIKPPLTVTDSITVYDIFNTAAFIFGELGQSKRESYALSEASSLRRSIRDCLVKGGIVEGECQTSQAMFLYYGVAEHGSREYTKALKALLGMIEVAGGHMDCGILGARAIFRLLADEGFADLAFSMITRRDGPSFGEWIADGATSMYENFGKPQSRNHHFYGDISAFFIRYVAGLSCVFDNVCVSPCFISCLDYAEASCRGVSVRWERVEADKILLTVDCPEETVGRISLRSGCFADGCDEIPLLAGEYEITI